MFIVNETVYRHFIQAFESCCDGGFIYTPKEMLIKPNYTMLNNLILKLKTIPVYSKEFIILQSQIKELMNNFLKWENINFRKYGND